MKKTNPFLALVFLLPLLLLLSACTSEIKEEISAPNLEEARSIQLINAELKPSFIESLVTLQEQGELQKAKYIELVVDRSIDKLFFKGEFAGHLNFDDNRLAVQADAVHVGEDTYAYLMEKYADQKNNEIATERVEDCPGCMSFYECICMGNLCVWYLRCVPADGGPSGGGPMGPGGGCGLFTCDDNGELKTYCLSGPVGSMGGDYPPCPPNVCG